MHFQSEGGILALLGASGCGKSMTLKCIAGIETPDEGQITLDGVTLFDSAKRINMPPQKRKTGYLFQNAALFPNMTAAQNILCGLSRIKDSAEKQRRLSELISMFRLDGLELQYPHELSGGQQQRTALARILASEPELIMLDEPFSALDSHLKWQLEQELGDILKKLNKKTIYVSHDRNEVYRLCNNIAIVADGSVDSIGSKDEIFSSPATYAACLLTGCKNISKARQNSIGTVTALDWGLELKAAASVSAETSFVGVRANYIKSCTSLGLPNSFEYEILEKINDLFTVILLIKNKAAPQSSAIRWELSREKYEKLSEFPAFAFFPPESILLLRK
jgi:molybdate transport system ATP-binding protein